MTQNIIIQKDIQKMCIWRMSDMIGSESLRQINHYDISDERHVNDYIKNVYTVLYLTYNGERSIYSQEMI